MERLSEDDMAAQRAEEFRAGALLSVTVGPKGVPGVCSNCLSRCLPLAVYCDEACRTDHEERCAAERRMGRAT